MTELRPFDLGELNLDTIAFERLVADARQQIPRFSADWTDHNLHDPGMTVIDLLGWVVDQQIYRLGFISDRHLHAFAALLGQRPVGPKPAAGLVWSDRAVENPLLMAAGKALLPNVAPDVGFVLMRDVFLSDAEQTTTSIVCGGSEIQLPIRRSGLATTIAAGSDSMVVLTFDRPLVADLSGPVSVGFDISGGVESNTSSAPWGPLRFDYRIGGGAWVEVPVLFDDTSALTSTGTVGLDIPSACGSTEPSTLRLRFDNGFFPLDVSVRSVAVNTLPVIQIREEPERSLGQGTGLVNQTVSFDRVGLVAEPVIMVDDQQWTARPDFCTSGPDDTHYVLGPNGATFGNGVNGARPPKGSQLAIGPTQRTAGVAGNLRTDVSWTLDGVVGWTGRNCSGFSGGANPSTVDDVVAKARGTATERDNLLSNTDVVAAALLLPGFGVGRAEVIPNYDPAVPDGKVAGTRALMVFPERAVGHETRPVPSQYLQAVDDALDSARVLGERLVVVAPQVVVIDVEVTVTVEPGYILDRVEAEVESNLRQRLAVLDQDGGVSPWTLGRVVTIEELKTVAAETDGVMFVSDCGLARSGQKVGGETVELKRHGLAVAGDVQVTATVVVAGQGGKRL